MTDINDILPPEIINEVASFCNPRVCIIASMVCKSWHKIFSTQFNIFEGNIDFTIVESIKQNVRLDRIYKINGNLNNCNIEFFPNLCYVSGNMEIPENTKTVKSLENLTIVNGRLSISKCTALTSLDGLSNLTKVGKSLDFSFCTSLTCIDGLLNITFVGASLCFYGCKSLTSINGLSNLITVGRDVNFGVCESLSSVETNDLPSLTFIGGDLSFRDASRLTRVDGLTKLTSIHGSLIFGGCESLISVDGFTKLNEVYGYVTFKRCTSLISASSLANLPNLRRFIDPDDHTTPWNQNGTLLGLSAYSVYPYRVR